MFSVVFYGNREKIHSLLRFKEEKGSQMGCIQAKNTKGREYEDPVALARQTYFSVSEVEALYELFKRLSNSLVEDGCIHREEFQLALFRRTSVKNLLADRIFDLFDTKGNGVINFGEFVRSMSIFHPNSPAADKISFAFNLYDLRHTGFIEREEVTMMVQALLKESELNVSDDDIEHTVNMTFAAVDSKGDGRIDPDEWRDFAARNPSSIQNMTVSYLQEITTAFPSFIFRTEVEDGQLCH